MKKKILWVTADYFADVDVPVVPLVAKDYYIIWVILQTPNPRYGDHDFYTIEKQCKDLKVEIVHLGRERYPSNALKYFKVFLKVVKEKPDIVYMNLSASSPWQVPMLRLLPKKITIVTAHQGRIHEGMNNNLYFRTLRKSMYGRFTNIHMFSKSQAAYFQKSYPNSKVYLSYLGLKYFGEPTNKRPKEGDIRFLSFGIINYTKNIDLLINAACLLYERGVRGFIVSINGMCNNWDWYQKQIKYPEIFETNIRMIANEEIPNLFNGSHYLVQPYRVVSQSGPTKVAFQYNLPVLTSNLSGFTDEVVEGVNGYTFEKGNAESLAEKMQMLIKKHSEYDELLRKEDEYTKKYYSNETLIKQYEKMFNEILVNNG